VLEFYQARRNMREAPPMDLAAAVEPQAPARQDAQLVRQAS
jgi:hypothetical protein